MDLSSRLPTSSALLLALALACAACATVPGAGGGDDALAACPGDAPLVFDAATDARLAPASVDARLAAARHVHVGERHGDPNFHDAQREVLQALLDAGRDVAVAIEWLPPSAQPELDRWLASDAPTDALAAAVDWPRAWGHDFAAYAPTFLLARARGVPVVAVNAEHALARAVARTPLEDLDPDVRAQLPPLDTWDAAHFERFRAMMEEVAHAHPLSAEAMDRYYLAQLVRDESMSLGAARLLEDPDHPDRVVVVFAGLGHVAHGHGVPLRLARLTALPFAVVRPITADEVAERGLRAVEMGPTRDTRADDPAPPYPEREADLLWLARCRAAVAARAGLTGPGKESVDTAPLRPYLSPAPPTGGALKTEDDDDRDGRAPDARTEYSVLTMTRGGAVW